MSAQIIEFPMNRVRPAQQAVRTPGNYRSRTASRQMSHSRVTPVAIARAIVGWTLIVVVTFGLLFGAGKQIESAQASGTESSSAQTTSFEYITVMSGDTLWSIAEENAPNRDPRDFIDDIVALNNLSDSVVDAGMRLALPAN